MSISTDTPQEAAKSSNVPKSTEDNTIKDDSADAMDLTVDTSNSRDPSVDPTKDFTGDLDTNNMLPTMSTIHKVESFQVLDKDGKARPFKSLYTGPNVPRRVLVIFIRHFFCGMCQEYLRSVSQNINPTSLLQLPVPTALAIVGCGSPTLIPMYQEATQCPFDIYADPTGKLYKELGMVRTLALGDRPEYIRKGMLTSMIISIGQGLRQAAKGRGLKSGALNQVGGEFLFEPVGDIFSSPVVSPHPLDGENKESREKHEEKRVAWCHRMKNTRDHAEIPELREVLGFDGAGLLGKNSRRMSKALEQRKGTGFSSLNAAKEEPTKSDTTLVVPPPVEAGH